MSVPQVTVVIPTRNRVALVGTTLRSVLAQTDVDLEVVLIDDGSTEEAATGLEALVDDPRVTLHRNPSSQGVAAARNQGIAAARGPWVAFCDDDDLWTPAKLSDQLRAVIDAQRRWVYSGAVKFEAGPVLWQVMAPPTPEVTAERLAWQCVVPAGASNVLAERSLLELLGGYDERLAHMADWDLWLRLLEDGPPAVAEHFAVAYRLHGGAMSLNPRGILTELAVIDRRYRHLRSGAALDAGPTHLWIAMSWLRAGKRCRAAASYLRAVRTRPAQGLRGAIRTLHPHPPRPAHILGSANGGPARLSRFKRVEQHELDASMVQLLLDLGDNDPRRPTPR